MAPAAALCVSTAGASRARVLERDTPSRVIVAHGTLATEVPRGTKGRQKNIGTRRSYNYLS
jgi:hypothetical protein